MLHHSPRRANYHTNPKLAITQPHTSSYVFNFSYSIRSIARQILLALWYTYVRRIGRVTFVHEHVHVLNEHLDPRTRRSRNTNVCDNDARQHATRGNVRRRRWTSSGGKDVMRTGYSLLSCQEATTRESRARFRAEHTRRFVIHLSRAMNHRATGSNRSDFPSGGWWLVCHWFFHLSVFPRATRFFRARDQIRCFAIMFFIEMESFREWA